MSEVRVFEARGFKSTDALNKWKFGQAQESDLKKVVVDEEDATEKAEGERSLLLNKTVTTEEDKDKTPEELLEEMRKNYGL